MAYYAVVALFHVAGWGLFLYYGSRLGAVYASAGTLAYAFGLRHAFDADHISAISDSTRFLLQNKKTASGTGFYFSLGHSTVVIVLVLFLAVAANTTQHLLPVLQDYGGVIGTFVSGTFLLVIAAFDFLILRDVIGVWKKSRSGKHKDSDLDELLSKRGFMNRIVGKRWQKFIASERSLYPTGLLFGLGLDTATEVGLLALTVTSADTGDIPIGALIALPLLFTAGMTLLDTTDGVFMTKAYGWAYTNPLRKIYYNMVTVGIGVCVAGFVGLIQYMELLRDYTGQKGALWSWQQHLNFERLGLIIVASFAVCWAGAFAYYKYRRLDKVYLPADS